MQLEQTKTTAAAIWLVTLGTVSVAVGVTSVAGWILLAGLTLLPPIAMWRLWNHPRKSMSESIQEARR